MFNTKTEKTIIFNNLFPEIHEEAIHLSGIYFCMLPVVKEEGFFFFFLNVFNIFVKK